METTPLRAKILETVVGKSNLKQKVFDNTFAAFNLLKDTLFELAAEMDDELDGKLDRRTRLEYRDRGKFEAQLQIASDLLIFQMHSDVFTFDDNHLIWQNAYVQEHRENCYFVEGKQQSSLRATNFGKGEISREALLDILEAAIYYVLNFDLLLPPYEDNKRVTVDQFNTKLDNSKFVTGKRLGYDFNVDDI